MNFKFKVYVQEVKELFADYSEEYAKKNNISPHYKYGENWVLSPVYEPRPEGGENHTFWTASPQGLFTTQVNNPRCWGQVRQGDTFYLTLEPAPSH